MNSVVQGIYISPLFFSLFHVIMNAHTFDVADTDDALPTSALFVTTRNIVTDTDNVLPTQLMDYS